MSPLHIPKIEDYGISAELGFLSSQCPAASFGDCGGHGSSYARWDELMARLPRLISSRTHRSEIRALPTLDAGELASSEAALHRAYVVLGFLIHAYVWGGRGEEPVEIVPPQLAVPFLDVCSRLGMHPVLSYAGLCLWNWKARHDAGAPRGGEGFFELDQLEGLASFTGTRGEDAFNHVPVLVEATGGPLIPLLLDAVSVFTDTTNNNNNNNNSTNNNKITRDAAAYVREALANASKIIAAMGRHLAKLYSTVDAQMFYHELRPFLAGGKSMEKSGLARGFVFQLADGTELPVQHGGGSAAQSSLFHFLDAILGVEHEQPRDGSGSLFREMRGHMPGKHHEFLNEVAKLPSIRTFVDANPSNEELRRAFDDCLKELRLWRGKHIAVVSKYIIRPARLAAAKSDVDVEAEQVNDARSDGLSGMGTEGEDIQGTGGSALIPFLRQTRDETV